MPIQKPGPDEIIIQKMVECGRVLTKRGLNNITSGNESFVSRGIGELGMYITRSSSKLGHLDEPTAIVKTSLNGYDGNMVLASSEADIHKEIHRRRFEVNPDLGSCACIHAHTIFAAALSIGFDGTGIWELEIPEKYRGKRLSGAVPAFTSRYGSGAQDMVENMPAILIDEPIMILGNHGAFAVDEDLGEALEYLIELEEACERIVSDRVDPQIAKEIEGRAGNWLDLYSIVGPSNKPCSFRGGEPKTIGVLMHQSYPPSDEEARMRYLSEIFDEFRVTGRDLTDFAMDPYRRGSLSRRIGNTIYITRAGVDLSNLGMADLIVFRMGEGGSIGQELCESWLHEKIYGEIATSYITHLLPEYSSNYSVYCGDAIIPIDVEGRYLVKRIPVADLNGYILGEENADLLIDELKSNEKIAYVKGLGGFAIGLGGLYEPLHHLESAESSVKMITLAEKMGIDVGAKQEMFREW